MAISNLNHAVLYVRDAEASAGFYRDVLGFRTTGSMGGGRMVFLQAPDSDNDHDLALFSVGPGAGPSAAGRSTVGLYHLAWQVGTLRELVEARDRLQEVGALVGASDHVVSKSLYARDPDGIEFEVMWAVPPGELAEGASAQTLPLDLDGELERWGPDLVTDQPGPGSRARS